MLFTAASFADKIGPMDKDVNIVVKEKHTVILKCSFESKSNNIWIYWYKQHPNSAPQFLLIKGARSYTSHGRNPTNTRIEAKTTSDSTELIISELKFSDSALYHCALTVGAQ